MYIILKYHIYPMKEHSQSGLNKATAYCVASASRKAANQDSTKLLHIVYILQPKS